MVGAIGAGLLLPFSWTLGELLAKSLHRPVTTRRRLFTVVCVIIATASLLYGAVATASHHATSPGASWLIALGLILISLASGVIPLSLPAPPPSSRPPHMKLTDEIQPSQWKRAEGRIWAGVILGPLLIGAFFLISTGSVGYALILALTVGLAGGLASGLLSFALSERWHPSPPSPEETH